MTISGEKQMVANRNVLYPSPEALQKAVRGGNLAGQKGSPGGGSNSYRLITRQVLCR
jgi:hypothetical protein